MHDPKLKKLKSILDSIPQADYPKESRVHPLKTFPSGASKCFVKRDDELGGVFAGSKLRKYRTLVPHLLEGGYSEAVVIGGAYSNNVLGVTQLLIENNIKPVLFLRGEPRKEVKGNALFTSLLVPAESIHWVPRKEWPHVQHMAEDYIQKSTAKAFLLPEGASAEPAFAGALTLALDIIRNEEALALNFDHLFVESGTGMMAASLILALTWLEKPTVVHVLLMAEGEPEFNATLRKYKLHFENLVGESCHFPLPYRCYSPQSARSFGGTNKKLFDRIRSLAQSEGFFCDPIYTAKLFAEAKDFICQQELSGNILIVHSGGTFALAGFQEDLF